MSSVSTGSVEFRNARVLDGTGGPVFTAHVLVDGDRIERVGDEPAGADRVIDLDGAYLAPGFVDMHAHSELRLMTKPAAEEKLTQGITTEVLGQDGVSVAPVPDELKTEWEKRIQSLDGTIDRHWPWNSVSEYLDELDEAAPAVNAAHYAPHGNLRSHISGFEDRELATAEIAELQERLDQAIDGGAFGMSTGMIYPPSSYGRDPELEALAETLATRDSFMISHVWNETDHVVESIDRYLGICRRGGCHAHVSHLKVGGRRNWGRSADVLDLFDDAVDAGQRVSFDQYPYTAGSTMLTALLPPWARRRETSDILERLRRADVRERLAEDISSPGDWENLARAAGTWDNILITRTASGDYQGNTIEEIATERNLDPIDTLCELLVEENLDVTMADFVMAEEDIERFLADDRGTFCTDGIFGGKPHPRAVGTFGRILERYVRERDVLSPSLMARKAAGHPADILGLADRGYVKEGYVADLVAFDLDAVSENATYEDPIQYTDGFDYVLVGGAIAVEDGATTDVRNGEILRSTDEWDGRSRPSLDRSSDE
ncbi:N-acyl-D-glutamate deacylase (plasmid) [Haloterrigena turkmenica DSM 5511]|uniref:N-acyl-D-glutamate deacylase n=1 Tax=Haloterrigena turkmenica (strain ATCC 51198 / DSM 5511 / JCM 9101 / NCIMB 13204 / VKM B-1734 / 4k) TaxID=543526 RepID=D2S0A5_HALTV|nr:D-aminoacylase [Haloterrigena turkmenica]ADB62802.1 N-acyl-D-glutamate deacylase [Haloterrigena turkmenica DSM 5511]